MELCEVREKRRLQNRFEIFFVESFFFEKGSSKVVEDFFVHLQNCFRTRSGFFGKFFDFFIN